MYVGTVRRAFRNIERALPVPRFRRDRGGATRPARRILDHDLVPRSSRSARLRRERTGIEVFIALAALLAIVIGGCYAMFRVLV